MRGSSYFYRDRWVCVDGSVGGQGGSWKSNVCQNFRGGLSNMQMKHTFYKRELSFSFSIQSWPSQGQLSSVNPHPSLDSKKQMYRRTIALTQKYRECICPQV